jgi:CO/xanthine dehydrogenase Mo-binding subunit
MRGFGVLQVAVAHESQMDMLARGLGISPIEFRLINCLKPGLTTATGQVVNEGTGIGATLQRIKEYMSQHGLEWSSGLYPRREQQSQPASDRDLSAATSARPVGIWEGRTTR